MISRDSFWKLQVCTGEKSRERQRNVEPREAWSVDRSALACERFAFHGGKFESYLRCFSEQRWQCKTDGFRRKGTPDSSLSVGPFRQRTVTTCRLTGAYVRASLFHTYALLRVGVLLGVCRAFVRGDVRDDTTPWRATAASDWRSRAVFSSSASLSSLARPRRSERVRRSFEIVIFFCFFFFQRRIFRVKREIVSLRIQVKADNYEAQALRVFRRKYAFLRNAKLRCSSLRSRFLKNSLLEASLAPRNDLVATYYKCFRHFSQHVVGPSPQDWSFAAA